MTLQLERESSRIREPAKGLSAMSELSIRLEGFPEEVLRIADVLEEAFPGLLAWVQSRDVPVDATIKIEGYKVPEWADTINVQTVARLNKC